MIRIRPSRAAPILVFTFLMLLGCQTASPPASCALMMDGLHAQAEALSATWEAMATEDNGVIADRAAMQKDAQSAILRHAYRCQAESRRGDERDSARQAVASVFAWQMFINFAASAPEEGADERIDKRHWLIAFILLREAQERIAELGVAFSPPASELGARFDELEAIW